VIGVDPRGKGNGVKEVHDGFHFGFLGLDGVA
jgi:hypothetical protein